MGHVRIGRLPKTLRWREVVALIDESAPAAAVAAATAAAAERRLRRLADDPAFGYPVWLLTRVTWAARGETFADDLARLGIALPIDVSPLGTIALLTDHVRSEMASWPGRDNFSELATQAFRQALTDTVAREGASLFDGDAADVQRAFRAYSTRASYGVLARRFFAAFASRALASFVDRELANHYGSNTPPGSRESAIEFRRELDRHVWQTARIVEDFAGDWYSKHNWESKGRISPEETQRFLAIALRKLRRELQSEAEA